MSVIEKFAQISQTISKLIEFAATEETLKMDFEQYSQKYKINDQAIDLNSALFQFCVDGRLGDDNQTVVDFYVEQKQNLSDEEKSILQAFKSSITSFFEVKKRLKNGFELLNIINDENYTAMPLVKMVHFRDIYAGQFMLATLLKHEGTVYLIEIKDLFSCSEKSEVYRAAVAAMIENPSLYYKDSLAKQQAVEDAVKQMKLKFLECFGTETVFLTNSQADEAMEIFDNFLEDEIDINACKEFVSTIIPPTEFKYFKVEELDGYSESFIENAMGGFSSHEKSYDVGIVFIDGYGLYLIPFYGTLCHIFEVEDYKTVEGYKECIINFLSNNSLPPMLLEILSVKYSNFLSIVNEVLGKDYTLETLIKRFKSIHLEQKRFSAVAVLCCSELFQVMMDELNSVNLDTMLSDIEPLPQVGRNEPCPCGSGKKFKKCCMNK